MSEAILRTDGLTKIFELEGRKINGVIDVNLEVMKGESIAIKGPSGSGKTTLLTILGCLDRPTSGKMMLDGVEVSGLPESELYLVRRDKVGFVFQSFNLMPYLSAVENVELPMELTIRSKTERREKASRLLAMVGLSDREDHRPSKLSAGQQQRVAIARALANDPAILLADEPTGNLDSKNKMEIIRLIRQLNTEKGMTVVMVTHDNRIASMAGRVMVIKDGRLKVKDPSTISRPKEIDLESDEDE